MLIYSNPNNHTQHVYFLAVMRHMYFPAKREFCDDIHYCNMIILVPVAGKGRNYALHMTYADPVFV